MVEGDFVRGFIKAHDSSGKIILNEDFGAAFGKEIKGHYGADYLMLKDINEYLINSTSINLPVGIIDCMEVGLVAMKIDEARISNKIIDLTDAWKKLEGLII